MHIGTTLYGSGRGAARGHAFQPDRSSRRPRPARARRAAPLIALAVGLGIGIAGCSHPLDRPTDDDLRTTILRANQRHLEASLANPEQRTLQRTPSTLEFTEERIAELNRLAGPESYRDTSPEIGPDLLNRETATVRLDLNRAVASAVRNNLAVQRAEYSPAINAARTRAAEAAFDWILFADFEWRLDDQPGVVPVINGVPVGAGGQQRQTVDYSAGFRKPLTTGGTFSVSQGQTYTDDSTDGTSFTPDPSNRVFVSAELTQPLLRGFGSDVTLAQIRLSRNAEADAILALKQQLIDTVTETERAYWALVGTVERLNIRRRLLDRGIEVRDVLSQRRQFDVRQSEYADAVATVERRRGDVIRAENEVRLASDRLKRLINDPELAVGDETLVLPTDLAVEAPIAFSLIDSLTAAVDNRPELGRALLAIEDESVRVLLASNARLPLLDLAARATLAGLDSDTGDAYSQIFDGDYVNWLIGLQFEQPLGNRAAEAEYRAAQLTRLRSAVAYRQSLQDVVLSVVTALRELTTFYELIEQNRSSRLAAAENLRALQVQEQTIATLSPEFLDLKFRRQEALAQAEINEVDAKLAYAISIAEFEAAKGTTLERAGIALIVPENPEDPERPWR
ncbi:MAG: TolC family protein [Phycisphaerales bacterium]